MDSGGGWHRSRRADGRVRSPAAVRKRSCWAPWCFGHEQGNVAINAIHELVRDAAKPCVAVGSARQGRSPDRQGGRTGRRQAARCLPDPQQASPYPGLPRSLRCRDGWPRRPTALSSTSSRSKACCSTLKPASCAAATWPVEPALMARHAPHRAPHRTGRGVLPRTHGSAYSPGRDPSAGGHHARHRWDAQHHAIEGEGTASRS